MLKTRVIPCLLLKNRGLVKTIKFKDETYIGDPINAVKIFNDKEADELIFLDINASKEIKRPQYDLIKDIATECFMPVSYGGGVNDFDTVKKILRLGIEKIIFNSSAVTNPDLIKKAASIFGSQAIVVSIDAKKDFLGRYKVYIFSGTKNTGINVRESVRSAQNLGAGEIMINSIDRDGTMSGYDIPLLKLVSSEVKIPVIACGGAGKISDFKSAVKEAKVSAVAAGSLFVYSTKAKGILINYPERKVLEHLF